MLFGRMLSQSVAVVMTADGTVKVVTGIAAILATGGGGFALAPETCGASIVVAGMAIPIEALLVLEGAGEIAWAQVVFAAAKKHPVGGGSSSRRFPEKRLLGSKKHGIYWQEGPSRARQTGNPQGKFGSVNDVNWVVEQSYNIPAGSDGYAPIPNGMPHDMIVYMPDGTTVNPTQVFIKVYPSGKVHAFPVP